MSLLKKMKKTITIDIHSLQYSHHEEFLEQKYLVADLKLLCEKWNLDKKGKKQELKDRIYKHMVLNSSSTQQYSKEEYSPHHILCIQKWVRSIFPRLYIRNKYEMVAPKQRTTSIESENSVVDDVAPCQSIFQKLINYENKCIIENDFLTIEPIKQLPHYQRIMFREHNVIYGFDLSSFCQYMEKSDIKLSKHGTSKECINPYTRQVIKSQTITRILRHIRLSHILKFPIDVPYLIENTVVDTPPINIYLEQDYQYYLRLNLSPKEQLHRRVADIFQYFDTFGNYTNANWFLDLNFPDSIYFLRQLKDIWEYRSQISPHVRNCICPNSHLIHNETNPFYNIHPLMLVTMYQQARTQEIGIINVKHRILNVLDRMTKYGISDDYKSIAVMFVLSALTLASQDAANSMPWLYNSVAHNE